MLQGDKKSKPISYIERENKMRDDIKLYIPKNTIDEEDGELTRIYIPKSNEIEEKKFGNIPEKSKTLVKNNIQPNINKSQKPKFN